MAADNPWCGAWGRWQCQQHSCAQSRAAGLHQKRKRSDDTNTLCMETPRSIRRTTCARMCRTPAAPMTPTHTSQACAPAPSHRTGCIGDTHALRAPEAAAAPTPQLPPAPLRPARTTPPQSLEAAAELAQGASATAGAQRVCNAAEDVEQLMDVGQVMEQQEASSTRCRCRPCSNPLDQRHHQNNALHFKRRQFRTLHCRSLVVENH